MYGALRSVRRTAGTAGTREATPDWRLAGRSRTRASK